MKQPTVKFELRTSKMDKSGLCPVWVRYTKDRKSTFDTTEIKVPAKYWNETEEKVRDTHPNHEQLNTMLLQKRQLILDILIKANQEKRILSADDLKSRARGDLSNIFTFIDTFIDLQRKNEKRSEDTLAIYKRFKNKLATYLDNLAGLPADEQGAEDRARVLTFEQIDVSWLEQFEAWLRANTEKRAGSDGNNYINLLLVTFRTFFNAAIKRKVTANYPFEQYEMPGATGGKKDHLSLEELRRWHKWAMECEHPNYKQSALFFLFACYTGLRVSDWKQFSEATVQGGQLSMEATKNKAWLAVPIETHLEQLLEKMHGLQLTVVEQTVNNHLKEIAKLLEIKKHLTTHCGRKTFAVTVCLERGVTSESAAELMGITLAVFVKSYSFVTPQKIRLETERAWQGLI